MVVRWAARTTAYWTARARRSGGERGRSAGGAREASTGRATVARVLLVAAGAGIALFAAVSLLLPVPAGGTAPAANAPSPRATSKSSAHPTSDPGSKSRRHIAHNWPVEGPKGASRPMLTRPWEPPASRWAAGHRGVDLASRPGRPVRAVAAGRVSFAGKVAGRGVLTIVLSETGSPPLRTTYEPVVPRVRKGARVRAGQRVAVVGKDIAHCRGRCLHWGALRGDRYLDPLSLLPPRLLRVGATRLLPVFGIPVPRGAAGEHTADKHTVGEPATSRTHAVEPKTAPVAGPAPAKTDSRTVLPAAVVWGRLRGRAINPRLTTSPLGRDRSVSRAHHPEPWPRLLRRYAPAPPPRPTRCGAPPHRPRLGATSR